MEYVQEDYTKHYIVQALFRLMGEYEFDKISITDIVKKAGVGRATFYRHYKSKEDVIFYYFEHHTREFMFSRRFYPRCRTDYVAQVTDILTLFKKEKGKFQLIRRAHLEYIYLDYLNGSMCGMFEKEFPSENKYVPYGYAGMLFNISMAWLDSDCTEEIGTLAETIVDKIYFGQ